jgi:hypothetical protein
MVRTLAGRGWSEGKRSNGRESGDRRAGIDSTLGGDERMTACLEADRETLLLGLVWGKFAELGVESRAFS